MNSSYFAFGLKVLTAQGYSIAIACICDKDKAAESEAQISKVKNLNWDDIKDPMYIDYKLAACIKEISPSYIYAVGASAHIPGLSDSSGGIIGSPHKDIYSANKYIEYIRGDLVMCSRPGGPGFVIQGGENDARYILSQTGIPSSNKESCDDALNILQCMINRNIDTGIIVTDGSGAGSRGCVIAHASGKSSTITL